MARARAREFADEFGLCGIEAAQQFMQGAQNLFGERGRDSGLALPGSCATVTGACDPKSPQTDGTNQCSSFKPPNIGRPATVPSARSGKVKCPEVSPRGA